MVLLHRSSLYMFVFFYILRRPPTSTPLSSSAASDVYKRQVTGVVALLNDMVVIFGIFVVLRIPLNGNFIAAMLVILGYSINDTVVIYDRIRENGSMVNKKHTDFAQLVNAGINQSLTRTINTTLTTLLALGTVCVVSVVFGLDSIFTFSFPLIIGMVSGVYSSICIAGPLWVESVSYTHLTLPTNREVVNSVGLILYNKKRT